MKNLKKCLVLFLSVFLLTSCTNNQTQLNESNTSSTISQSKNETKLNSTTSTVTFLNVGQADCTLVQSGDDVALIDTGDIDNDNYVINYLKNANISHIDHLILTHPHADHMGEASDIIKSFEVENIIMPNKISTTNVYEQLLDTIQETNHKITVPNQGDVYNIGDGTITILTDQTIDWGDDLNYSSLIMKVSFNDVSFVITGDADKEVEENVLEKYPDIKANVLKVGHHGSSTATSYNFLKSISPTYAVISCGKDNKYGHPHKETLDRLSSLGVNYFITYECGNIVFTTDGRSLDVNCKTETVNNVETVTDATYILNTNTMKIHKPDCKYATSISDKNKMEYNGDPAELLKDGYEYCKYCN